MTIKPIGNRAVIRMHKTQTTKSGIIISTKEENEQSLGEIVAIGNGLNTEEGNITQLGLQVGDTVLVSKYGGNEVKDFDDSDTVFKVISMNDILAIIEK